MKEKAQKMYNCSIRLMWIGFLLFLAGASLSLINARVTAGGVPTHLIGFIVSFMLWYVFEYLLSAFILKKRYGESPELWYEYSKLRYVKSAKKDKKSGAIAFAINCTSLGKWDEAEQALAEIGSESHRKISVEAYSELVQMASARESLTEAQRERLRAIAKKQRNYVLKYNFCIFLVPILFSLLFIVKAVLFEPLGGAVSNFADSGGYEVEYLSYTHTEIRDKYGNEYLMDYRVSADGEADFKSLLQKSNISLDFYQKKGSQESCAVSESGTFFERKEAGGYTCYGYFPALTDALDIESFRREVDLVKEGARLASQMRRSNYTETVEINGELYDVYNGEVKSFRILEALISDTQLYKYIIWDASYADMYKAYRCTGVYDPDIDMWRTADGVSVPATIWVNSGTKQIYKVRVDTAAIIETAYEQAYKEAWQRTDGTDGKYVVIDAEDSYLEWVYTDYGGREIKISPEIPAA